VNIRFARVLYTCTFDIIFYNELIFVRTRTLLFFIIVNNRYYYIQ